MKNKRSLQLPNTWVIASLALAMTDAGKISGFFENNKSPYALSTSGSTSGEQFLHNKMLPGIVKDILLTTDSEESFVRLMLTLLNKDLKDCDLVIALDQSFQNSKIMQILMRSSHLRQVTSVHDMEAMEGLNWKSPRCQGTLFLLIDPTPLLRFGNMDHMYWAYYSKVIIAGLTKEQMEIVITAKKLKKTRHILGIVKGDKPKHYEIFINTLYWGGGLVHAAGWRGRAFTTVSLDYFPDKISNLRQNPLNVITFEFPPSIIYHRDSEGKLLYRYGWDVSVVEALAQAFNFTIVYKEPPPDERWGDKQPNGTWSGMIGQFSRDEGDVGIANLYITNRQGRRNHQDFSTPFGDDKSCYLARVEPPLPHWMSLALPFQTTAWIASIIGLIITGPILYLIARASAKSKYEERHLQSLSYSILYVIGDLLRQPSGSLPLRTSTQIFVVFLGLACMILTIAYTSNLTAFLTVTRHPKGVETIKELYESGKMVFDLNPFFQRYMSGSENRYLRALSERFESIPNYDDIQPKVLDGEGVMIQSKGYLLYVSAHLAIPQGKPRVRLMKLKKQEEKMKETVSPETYEEEEEEGGVIPLGIDHLQGIFIILAFGCFVSTSVFFLELALALFLK